MGFYFLYDLELFYYKLVAKWKKINKKLRTDFITWIFRLTWFFCLLSCWCEVFYLFIIIFNCNLIKTWISICIDNPKYKEKIKSPPKFKRINNILSKKKKELIIIIISCTQMVIFFFILFASEGIYIYIY